MNPATLEKLKQTAAEYLYRQLIAADRSEDYTINFLKMKIKKRRLTYKEVRKISNYFGEILAKKISEYDGERDSEWKKTNTKNSLNEAWSKYRAEYNEKTS